MNNFRALIVVSLFGGFIALIYFVPAILFLLGFHYIHTRSWPVAALLFTYAFPILLALCFGSGPFVRILQRAKRNEPDIAFDGVNKRVKDAIESWSKESPQMGLIARSIYGFCTTLYLVFYFPVLFLGIVWISRFTPEKFHRNHNFSWFIVFVIATYTLVHTGHLNLVCYWPAFWW
jgi:hypothetical protein